METRIPSNISEKRILNVSRVLEVFRSVNETINRVKDKKDLIKEICKNFTKIEGYFSSFIILLDENGKIVDSTYSGSVEQCSTFTSSLERKEIPNCIKSVLETDEQVLKSAIFDQCDNSCPLLETEKNNTFLKMKLEHKIRRYGMIGITTDRALINESKEIVLFQDIADIISSALYRMEIEDERKKDENEIKKQNVLLTCINEICQAAIEEETSEGVANACLRVAEKITNSEFGFIGLINKNNRFDIIAISNPGWDACLIPESDAARKIKDMEIRGLYGWPLINNKSLMTNDPTSHPASIGFPKNHPKISSFLAVPLLKSGKSIGMIALANKEGGYDIDDKNNI
ncbi:MAG: GAF domain-containing protein, partial [Candidatus Helarchaeota archaeon]